VNVTRIARIVGVVSVPRWLKPWMVAATLGVVGVAGATSVYLLAQRQHRIDREDVVAWQGAVLPSLSRVNAAFSSGSIEAARSRMSDALAVVRARPDIKILRPVRAAFVAALEHPAPDRARVMFERALEELRSLRCRVRLPDCRTIRLYARGRSSVESSRYSVLVARNSFDATHVRLDDAMISSKR
jgi:hypothetical protein